MVKTCNCAPPELQKVVSCPAPQRAGDYAGSAVKSPRPLPVLALAAMVPAIALCFLEYRSLVELETKSSATAREALHEALASSAHRFETKIQEIAAGVLDPIPAPSAAPAPELIARFAAARQAMPAIREVFLVSECACPEPVDLYSSGQETIVGQRLDLPRQQRIVRAFHRSRSAGGTLTYFVETDAAPSVYAFRTIDPHRTLFAGLTLDAAALFRQALAPAPTDPLAFTVVDSQNRRIWQSHALISAPEAELTFGPLAAEWLLQGRHRGTSIETLAHRQFQRGVGLLAFVLACLLLGAVMTIRAATREARAAALQSAFIANISHEMKTPLALIRMFSETLELGRIRDPGRLAEYYGMLNREARKLTSLIESVLEFGRMEAGRKEYRMRPAGVAEIVEQVIGGYEFQLRSGGFSWKTEIEPDLPPADLDPAALSQAVGNLLDNAIKYSSACKAITVAVRREGHDIAISVTDCGIGVSPGDRQRIFDRFYRASSPLVHNTKGSGLGLAIARHIVEAHGGHIEVDSTPGQGSRFTILLPASSHAPVEPLGAEACPKS